MQRVIKYVFDGSLNPEYRKHVITVIRAINDQDEDHATLKNHKGWSVRDSSRVRSILNCKRVGDNAIIELAMRAQHYPRQLNLMGVTVDSLNPVFKPGCGFEECVIE